ncbi:MAG: general secretion pathway protein GspF [Gammaproteobacteria bacterium]|nr:general secretion pathway protein GspF [Gammaproteobacteria bacterium]MCW8911608.1 general secretion pathway protein GspF [Gammaproteobacteria bacterium]MCW9004278.1 general secretion pathway protein GspF [Gammaproteobacteria bacterium]MCW9055556.1 general secretion pathway protein GspF [Gammaproteobacteria bacterium]
MRRARTVDEYVALVKDAVYEVDEMRASIEYDEEGMGEVAKFIDELEGHLKEIYNAMLSGDYCWRTGDLKYMDLIRHMDEGTLPFRSLLIQINETHTKGLETEEQ